MQTPILVLMEDELIHTDERPFCADDPTCPCHTDPYLISLVQVGVQSGLISEQDAAAIIAGTKPATFAIGGVRVHLQAFGKKRMVWA